MTDSVTVFAPGFRVLDNNGDLVTDAVISFFEAGTTTPLEVFSDAGLSVSLGTEVDCNSAGCPVSSGNAKVLIYTGSAPYKVRISSVIFGGTIFEFDNVSGALDTSSFLTSAAVADLVIVPVSTNRTITVADKGKLIDVNCTAGALTMTLDPAATLGSGWYGGIRHNGTANQVKITGNGVNTFGLPGVTALAFSLTGLGQTVWISCDGTNFKVHSEVPALISNTTGVILIAGRTNTPPASPAPGARYIVTATPTGAWSSYAEHDIAEATGQGTWLRYTPAADCGWIAYVQDEDTSYSFASSAWKGTAGLVGGLTENTAPAATTTFIGIQNTASSVSEKVSARNITNPRFIQSGTLSSASELDIPIPASCELLEVQLINWRPATDNASLYLRYSQSAAFLSGATNYNYGYCRGSASDFSTGAAQIQAADAWGNASAEIGSIRFLIARPNASAFTKSVTWTGHYTNTSGLTIETIGGGALTLNTNAIDAIRFLFSVGNISTGYYIVRAYSE